MGCIRRLPPQEVRKIAAGEVVERPANAIKELIENARDAGATQIILEVQDGGKQFISIADNGQGMDPDDARLALEHHTTSKITGVHDLETLTTFGFRGEALASIAAVSTMTLMTKQAEATHGIQLEVKEGTITNEAIVAHNTGTKIVVRDLFDNVPARKKFLKKRESEWRVINQFLHAFLFSHPDLHLIATHDNVLALQCPSVNSLLDRCAQLWGPEVARYLLACSASNSHKNITVSGLISNHQHSKYDSGSIFCFVNNRWVKDTSLTRCLITAYQQVLPAGRYPLGLLFITVDPKDIDVNIHPRKQEVQFLHQKCVEMLVKEAVRQALDAHLSTYLATPVPFVHHKQPLHEVTQERPVYIPAPSRSAHNGIHPFVQNGLLPPALDSTRPHLQHIPTHTTPVPTSLAVLPPPLSPMPTSQQTHAIIGTYAATYILIQHSQGLFMVDQHAAHERVLYERFVDQTHKVDAITLMFPQAITVSTAHAQLLEPHLLLLHQQGFGIDILDNQQIIISTAPLHAKNIDLQALIREFIAWIEAESTQPHEQLTHTLTHKLCAQMACKAAVKAGDILSPEMMHGLIKDLNHSANKLTCPHGRPTGWLLGHGEIERKFKRTV